MPSPKKPEILKLPSGGAQSVTVTNKNGHKMARNPGHERDPRIAAKVKLCRSLGMVADTIGAVLDLGKDTVLKHYTREYEDGPAEANMRVGAAIFNSALGEEVECATCDGSKKVDKRRCPDCLGKGRIWIREPATTAQIWWSKNRMGWSDQQRIEHTGAGGGPILTEQVSSAERVKGKLEAIRARLEAAPANDKAA